MPDVTDIAEAQGKLSGLKKHSEEIRKLVVDSLADALLQLMHKKPYSEITVTELCRRAGVSRMAFYGNFSSRDDILRLIAMRLHERLIAALGSPFASGPDRGWYERLFAFVRESAETMRLMFDAGFRRQYLALLNEIVLSGAGESADKRYGRLAWIGGLENAVENWLTGGMRESESVMADVCAASLTPPGLLV